MSDSGRRVLPGFRPAISLTVGYVSLLILIPLATLVLKSASMGPTTHQHSCSSTHSAPITACGTRRSARSSAITAL